LVSVTPEYFFRRLPLIVHHVLYFVLRERTVKHTQLVIQALVREVTPFCETGRTGSNGENIAFAPVDAVKGVLANDITVDVYSGFTRGDGDCNMHPLVDGGVDVGSSSAIKPGFARSRANIQFDPLLVASRLTEQTESLC